MEETSKCRQQIVSLLASYGVTRVLVALSEAIGELSEPNGKVVEFAINRLNKDIAHALENWKLVHKEQK